MPAKLETQQWPKDWKRSVFIPIPKGRQCQKCSNYHTIALISHASEVTLKILQAGFNRTWTVNLQMLKLDLEKAEELESKLPTSAGSQKKQESSRKTFTSALLTMPNPLTLWITKNCGKFLKDMGLPDRLTCVQRNLYAGTTIFRTGHGTMDWFHTGKGVPQGCLLSLCLYN